MLLSNQLQQGLILIHSNLCWAVWHVNNSMRILWHQDILRVISQSIHGVSPKIVRHVWILLITKQMQLSWKDVCLRNTCSHTGYCRNTHCWVGITTPYIQVQGIRNDDQSLSPVTPLVSSLFLLFLIPWNVQELFYFTSNIKRPNRVLMVNSALLFCVLHAHFVSFYVLCFVGKVYPWPHMGFLSLGEAVSDELAQYISMRALETTQVVPNWESLLWLPIMFVH